MKVLLCYLPEKFGRGRILHALPPLGVLYVGTYLKNQGIEVKVLDAHVKGWSLKKTVEFISVFKPDILGISALTPHIFSVVQLVNEIRNTTKIKICLGGPHATAVKEEIFDYADVDFIINGEGERNFSQLCSQLLISQNYDDIKGLIYKRNGDIITNEGIEKINDINDLPFPDLDLIDYQDYRIVDGAGRYVTSIIASRGCPYNCLFCEVPLSQGRTLRLRDPENICEEIKLKNDKYHIKDFVFKDSTFTINKKWIYTLMDHFLTKGLKIKWTCNTRVDCIDLDMLKMMKKAGCRKISLGVESGNQTVLNNIRKNISIEQIEEGANLISLAGIDAHAFFMIGNPGENKYTVRETIELAKRIKVTSSVFAVTIAYPGTPLYLWAIKNHKLKSNRWYLNFSDKIFFQNPEQVSGGQLLLDDLSPEEQLQLMKRAYREYYFRPKWILGLIIQRKFMFMLNVIRLFPRLIFVFFSRRKTKGNKVINK